eukprot:COSAG05_NODE_10129_length_581_cov_2.448133_1_plen_23_part_01
MEREATYKALHAKTNADRNLIRL